MTCPIHNYQITNPCIWCTQPWKEEHEYLTTVPKSKGKALINLEGQRHAPIN